MLVFMLMPLEYAVQTLGPLDDKKLADFLNKVSKAGWDIVNCAWVDGKGFHLVAKRLPISPGEDFPTL